MKVYTSQIKGFDLPKAVDDHITALRAHTQMERVPVPVPENPLVELCVKRVQHPISAKCPDDFVPDYEIVDDAEYT